MARKGTKRARRSGRKGTRRQRGGVLKGIFNACGLGYVYNATLGKCMRKRGNGGNTHKKNNNNNNKNKNKKPTLPHNNEVPAAASTRRRGRAGSVDLTKKEIEERYKPRSAIIPPEEMAAMNARAAEAQERLRLELDPEYRWKKYGEKLQANSDAFQKRLRNEEEAKQKATANAIRNAVKRQEAADKAARREHARRVAEAKAILAAEPRNLTPAELAERQRWWGIQEAAYKRVMAERQGR